LFVAPNNGGIEFQNAFVRVHTGEGKSLIMAFCAILFAKCDFSVDCLCFSELLVNRDYQAFETLFQVCGVDKLIH